MPTFPADPNAPAPPQREGVEPTLILATWSSRHFEWTALAADKADAGAALLLGWKQHARETGADPDLMRQAVEDGEVTYTPIRVGDCLRDNALIHFGRLA